MDRGEHRRFVHRHHRKFHRRRIGFGVRKSHAFEQCDLRRLEGRSPKRRNDRYGQRVRGCSAVPASNHVRRLRAARKIGACIERVDQKRLIGDEALDELVVLDIEEIRFDEVLTLAEKFPDAIRPSGFRPHLADPGCLGLRDQSVVRGEEHAARWIDDTRSFRFGQGPKPSDLRIVGDGGESVVSHSIRDPAADRPSDPSVRVDHQDVLRRTAPSCGDVQAFIDVRGFVEVEDVEVHGVRLVHRAEQRDVAGIVASYDRAPAGEATPKRLRSRTCDLDGHVAVVEPLPAVRPAIPIGILRVPLHEDQILEVAGRVGQSPGDAIGGSDGDARRSGKGESHRLDPRP